ncbi:PREDICTED: probable protein phosphatase 2C 66 [Nelumbo nucifera]|uniref:protein-serine/threonine phosphatase n=2 Tax=Nelumbo nucifera TaxID=4432 RepID=A0A822XZU0_NELNU|nr:PREDICTED: probable protein phosphatase 2C 66 [Nelumbo nucifera]DAD24315.1 TPA_asm: hypothetical protein HUJ06_025779 [Nelumbo nucifera]
MGSCYSLLEGSVDSMDYNQSKIRKKKKKNSSSRNKDAFKSSSSFASSAAEQELHRIPGRMFLNGSSDIACLYTQQGKKGTNQDAMLVWENFGSRDDTIFCGVFDGHGPYGHMVAKKVRDSLPLKLCTQWNANSSDCQNGIAPESINSDETGSISMDDEWCCSLDIDDTEKLPDLYQPLKQSILKTFRLMDKELKMHPTIDCFCSGTTAVTLVKQGQNLVIGNVGDSRAVMGTKDKENSLVAVQLTVDLKPNLPREAARIQQCKGRVFALQDEPEVARVWLPNNDSPGLAMARAFGDFCLKDFGLISVPDVSYRRLTERDQFIILATDGVWDVLSNKEVVDIVASAPSRTTAARAVVDCAVRAWRLKFPTSKSDDCAVVCLFLDHTSQAGEETDGSTLESMTEESENPTLSGMNDSKATDGNTQPLNGPVLEQSSTVQPSGEIVPVLESVEEKLPQRCHSTRSLAECISTADDEEWSALEGVTRVNSLLNLPRFLSGDKRATSWRKWL